MQNADNILEASSVVDKPNFYQTSSSYYAILYKTTQQKLDALWTHECLLNLSCASSLKQTLGWWHGQCQAPGELRENLGKLV